MLSSKYLKYYRMDTQTLESGRVKRKMVYTGPLYEWTLSPGDLGKERKRASALLLAGWVFYIGSLLTVSTFTKVWYIVLPYAGYLLCHILESFSVWNLCMAKQPMDQETADKTSDRLKGCSLAELVLLTLAGVGMILQFFRNGISVLVFGDWLLVAAEFLLLCLAAGSFCCSRHFMMKEVDNPQYQIWKDR